MAQGLRERIESVLVGIEPSLGGAIVRLKDVTEGVVTVQYYRPLSNPSACHVDRKRTTKEIVVEVLEAQLREVVPGFKKVVLIDERGRSADTGL
jgi:hypothetical protein